MEFGIISQIQRFVLGQISPKDLDLPQSIFDQVQYRTSGVFRHSYISWLKPRSKWTHKGQFGHVLIVGGDYGMNGAPRLAALGAARTGAGLVTIATRPEHAVTMNINYPELMCHGVKNGRELKPLLSKATVVVIGPGLGQSGWAKSLYKTVLSSDLPLVVDADALNLLARNPFSRTNWILTPHPGEAARLLGTTSKQIEADRLKTVLSLQKQYGGICVLKGARTIIADEGQHPIICMAGNPGMASAGMGDLLSGVIGSLAAQGLPWWIAAELGVCLHAEAGDVASMDGERGMLASDLLPLLRFLANDLEPDKKSD